MTFQRKLLRYIGQQHDKAEDDDDDDDAETLLRLPQ